MRKNYFLARILGVREMFALHEKSALFPIGVVPRSFGSRRRVRLRELVRAETVRGADSTQQSTFESDQTAGLRRSFGIFSCPTRKVHKGIILYKNPFFHLFFLKKG